VQRETAGGTVLGSAGPPRPRHPLSLIVSFPAPCPPRPDIAPARVPPPPQLPEYLDDEELCYALARAYRSASTNRTGRRCWLWAKGDPRHWKDFELLVAAGKRLRELEVAPGAWIAWSFDMWKDEIASEAKPSKKPSKPGKRRRRAKRGSFPSPKFCFSLKHINDHFKWFRSEENQYEGGRTIFGERQRALMQRYDDMRRAVIHDGLSLADAAEKFFPGDSYEREVEAVREEVVENREKLVRQAWEGKFLW